MKISVITVSYNCIGEVEATCKSVADQTCKDFEWIVIDGASTDGTLEILKKYEDKMTVFISEPDKGIYDAMNKGIQAARGEYVFFLNCSDSFYDNQVIENVSELLKKCKEDILFGRRYVIEEDGSYWITNKNVNLSDYAFLRTAPPHSASAFIRRDLYKNYGLHPLQYKIAGDFERYLCFIRENKATTKMLPIITGYYKGFDGLSNSKEHLDQHITERKVIQKKYIPPEKIKEYHAIHRVNKKIGKMIIMLCPISEKRKKMRKWFQRKDFWIWSD